MNVEDLCECIKKIAKLRADNKELSKVAIKTAEKNGRLEAEIGRKDNLLAEYLDTFMKKDGVILELQAEIDKLKKEIEGMHEDAAGENI